MDPISLENVHVGTLVRILQTMRGQDEEGNKSYIKKGEIGQVVAMFAKPNKRWVGLAGNKRLYKVVFPSGIVFVSAPVMRSCLMPEQPKKVMITTHKTPGELLIGDVFVYEVNDKKHHFLVTWIEYIPEEGLDLKAEFLWSPDNKYFEHEVGYVDAFRFRSAHTEITYPIKKTTRHGCCKKCFGELHWVTMALKCSQCGIVY